jgi:hypothetical protein
MSHHPLVLIILLLATATSPIIVISLPLSGPARPTINRKRQLGALMRISRTAPFP